jgi:site-specific recombinase XerD
MFAVGLSCADAQEAMLRVLTRTLLSNPRLAGETPTIDDILRVWRADRSLQESSVGLYLQWIRRFRAYCLQLNLEERRELTFDGVRRFAAWYARRRHLHPDRLSGVRSALYSLARVYQVMGVSMPVWQPAQPVHPPATALMRAFAEHLSSRCGNPEITVSRKLDHVGKLVAHLASRGKTWRAMKLSDIDEFVVACSQRYARSTVADIASSIRSFARFLFATGRISVDLAASVMSPVQRRYERPRRALPWEDVQRLLRSIDTSTAKGLRDHALLLMMSTYGFGAGEVIRLRLEHIDWNGATLTVERPKTGITFTLPLVPAVAKALARYLRNGRPPATPTKHLFVQMKMPFHPLSASSAVRHILVKHAKIAGLEAPYLGSHVLHHSNASRHIDLGTRPRVLSDLLGHRDPESISAYVRIATRSLRDVSLPVPA